MIVRSQPLRRRKPLARVHRLRVLGLRALREQQALRSFRKAVLERAGRRCERCGSDRMLHAHHILPRSLGGTHDPENGACLCWRCHRLVHDGQVENYARWKRGTAN